MALDPSFIGHCYPVAGTYDVAREKIREFADAIGDDNALYRDPSTARGCGYSDVLAPPTFAMILVLRAQEELISDPKLGLDYYRMVHGSQSFTHHRPIQAGDELAVTLHVDDIRAMAGNDMLRVRCEITDSHGDPVTTARTLLVVRRADR